MNNAKHPPDRINPICYAETNTLRQAIIGYAHNLFLNKPILGRDQNNPTQAQNAAAGRLPLKEAAIQEFDALKDLFIANGVDVLTQDPCGLDTGVQSQMTVRDVGFGIGDTFFIANMFRANRRTEIEGIQKYVDRMPQDRVVRVTDSFIEGGNVIVHGGNVFVGMNERTNEDGVAFLATHTTLNVIPMPLQKVNGETPIHLDTAMMFAGNDIMLVSNGVDVHAIPSKIRNKYRKINVTDQEQADLATNVVSLSPNTIVTRELNSLRSVNDKLAKAGLNVLTLSFNQAPLRGGGLRCCVLPTIRQK